MSSLEKEQTLQTQLQQERTRAESNISKLTQDFESSKTRYTEMEKKLKSEIESTKAHASFNEEQLERQITEEKAKVVAAEEKLARAIKEHTDQMKSLQQELDCLADAKDADERQYLKDLDEVNHAANDKIEGLKREIQGIKLQHNTQLEALDIQLKQAIEEAKQLGNRYEEQISQLKNTHQGQLTKLRAENESERLKFKSTENQLKLISQELEEVRAQAKTEKDSLESQLRVSPHFVYHLTLHIETKIGVSICF